MIGKKAGLGDFGTGETTHFLGVGNAPARFRAEALDACEAAGEALVAHLREKGFADVAWPRWKLTVVVLADAKSYAAYAGRDEGLVIGGHFELDTNRLVMFDFRANQRQVAAAAERINTFTLIHETTHQLTFNVGLLDLKGDVPLCVSEGLATYGEVWRPKGRGKIGQVNHDRLKGLSLARRGGEAWLPLAKLLVEDGLLEAEATQQVAYAESWILIHSLMKTPDKLPKLRAYLAAIRARRDPTHRLDDARRHLGDLNTLDAAMRGYATRPIGA